MENSILWSAKFIPVYFIVALLSFILFSVIIDTNSFSAILIPLLPLGVGIASIISNQKTVE
ncbi:hypothetical protein GCM10007275_11180 [Jeotgalicoccus coquinae]|nr:hypothetical protein GCM10007275_11180 [Jeotgalicoccus coquinae]